MIVIDTNDNVTADLPLLKSKGVTAIGRYYSSSAWKRITKVEAAAISAAGIRIFTIFEDTGDPELSLDRGIHDAQIALSQAKSVKQPAGSAIYFAMEHLPNGYTHAHVPGIKLYGDASKGFDAAEEVFDEMPPLVFFSVVLGVSARPLAQRNDGLRVIGAQSLAQPTSVKSLSPIRAKQWMPAMRASKLLMSCL
jgi:hypothetical protein